MALKSPLLVLSLVLVSLCAGCSAPEPPPQWILAPSSGPDRLVATGCARIYDDALEARTAAQVAARAELAGLAQAAVFSRTQAFSSVVDEDPSRRVESTTRVESQAVLSNIRTVRIDQVLLEGEPHVCCQLEVAPQDVALITQGGDNEKNPGMGDTAGVPGGGRLRGQ